MSDGNLTGEAEGLSDTCNPHIQDVVARRLSRRSLLGSLFAAGAVAGFGGAGAYVSNGMTFDAGRSRNSGTWTARAKSGEAAAWADADSPRAAAITCGPAGRSGRREGFN